MPPSSVIPTPNPKILPPLPSLFSPIPTTIPIPTPSRPSPWLAYHPYKGPPTICTPSPRYKIQDPSVPPALPTPNIRQANLPLRPSIYLYLPIHIPSTPHPIPSQSIPIHPKKTNKTQTINPILPFPHLLISHHKESNYCVYTCTYICPGNMSNYHKNIRILSPLPLSPTVYRVHLGRYKYT